MLMFAFKRCIGFEVGFYFTLQCSTSQQTVVLLRQDKDYLTGQVNVLSQRVASSEGKVDYLNELLSEAKLSRENLYKQLIADKLGSLIGCLGDASCPSPFSTPSREQCRLDYDHRLERELDELKSRTSLQIDQLKLQTREFYERENHSLCQARDAAITDKERAITAEKEMRNLYEHLLKK